MTTTWILVAERSRARIFTLQNRVAPLQELESLVHPQSRLKESELVSDHAGGQNFLDGGDIVAAAPR